MTRSFRVFAVYCAVYLLGTLPTFGHLAWSAEVSAGAPAATRAEMAAELIRRWEVTKLPAFLEERRAVIDEVEGAMNDLEPNILRDLLAADDAREIRPNSSLIDPRHYSSLQHQTSSKHLLENIAKGELTPRASEKHWSRKGVYLELHLVGSPKPFAWGDTELHFDYAILDRRDYHVSAAWDYGNYAPDSASPAVNMGRTNYFFAKRLRRLHFQNEVVFEGPVPLSALKKIVVVKGLREKLLAEIKAAGLACPVPGGWEQLIEEREKFTDTHKL